MGSLQTKQRSAIAVVAGLVLALTGLVGPASAATSRTATLGVSPTTQNVGSPVTLTGNVSKSGKGAVVKIQRRAGSAAWVTAGQTKTTSTAGRYSVKLNLPAYAGTYSFRAYAPKTSKFRAAYSPARAVTALRKATATITSATPATIPLGSSSNLAGKVTPFTTGTVAVIQKLTSGTWSTATTATVKSDGTFLANVSPTATTTYRAYVPRNGLNAVAISAGKTVNVGPAQTPPNITSPATLPEGDKGVAYSTTLTKTGGAGTWSLVSGLLPAGVTLNGATGVLSGTPTAGGTTNFTIKFTETATNLTDSQAFTLVITPPPTITTASLPDATRGLPYTTTLAKTGKAGTWSLFEGNTLPAGLSLNATTGEISGTTTAAAATYPVYAVFTETSTSRTAFRALALKLVDAPPAGSPAITTTTLPDADKGVAYTTTLAKTGAAGTWSLNSGSLPAGITLTPATGELAGTPTAAGTASFEVKFTETTSGLSAVKALTLLVTPAPAITTTVLPTATRGAPYTTTLAKTGKAGTWSLVTNPPLLPLPAGLTLNPATGEISGTTTAAAATYPVYPVFTETSTGRQAAASLALTVAEPGTPGEVTITTTTLPDADKGVAYTTTLTKTGGAGVWTVVTGSLPAGITLAPATGVLSGTPTAGGTASFEVKFTETSSGTSALKALTLLVTPPPTITTTTLPDATRNVAYTATLAKTGKAGTWSLVPETTLPTGLTLDSATGVISGTTPGPAATYPVYPVFTETSTGRSVAAALSLKVGPADPVVTTTSIPTGITGAAYSQQLEKTGAAGTWALKNGVLPDGVTLSAAGLLAGTPTTVGDYGFTVTFTETATGFFDNQVYLLHVEAPGSPQITSPAVLPDATKGTPYSYTVDGDGTGTWSIAYQILPPGITLNAATGALTGTPTVKGDFLFILKYTTGSGSNTKVFSIHVADTP
ncbi:hypothetical protein EFK50_07230 [Nocardioides marmoriginsengisoli]|uniref:Uncharacterized protein n=1 Tax=Nocardioides marmoriginsengisoli TaxID=661483 RepID=A0A3N0CLZ2_9ACTN|nr:putative Ig domain-containing protein [Nocardioides marmoriginsengisoli]RNL64311.1 hypothetical protein EFK50_07230 [Nocardioides marmoriginsengisoli]